MVEGPKVVLKVQRIHGLRGQSLHAMVVMPTAVTSQPLTGPMEKCIGRVVQSVWCLGKELFIVMKEREGDGELPAARQVIGIRLHFGMAGSERLIQTSTLIAGFSLQSLHVTAKQMLPKQCRKKWTSCLIFNDQALFVYDSTIATKTSNYLDNAFLSLERDVMSYDKFSIECVVNQIRGSDQLRNIHEVIMDQSILPGVGNVIKIEGLFDAGMHPHCVTSEIDDEWLILLIRKLRDYARYWYDCCKGPGANKPNKKNVYGRPKCGGCNSIISLIRDGVLQRITYLCSTCQLFPAHHYKLEKLKIQKKGEQLLHPQEIIFIPGKGKICLEIKENNSNNNNNNRINNNTNNNNTNKYDIKNKNIPHTNSSFQPDWKCSYCTLDNKCDFLMCEICGTIRAENEKENENENKKISSKGSTSIPKSYAAAERSSSNPSLNFSAEQYSSSVYKEHSFPACVWDENICQESFSSCAYSEANILCTGAGVKGRNSYGSSSDQNSNNENYDNQNQHYQNSAMNGNYRIMNYRAGAGETERPSYVPSSCQNNDNNTSINNNSRINNTVDVYSRHDNRGDDNRNNYSSNNNNINEKYESGNNNNNNNNHYNGGNSNNSINNNIDRHNHNSNYSNNNRNVNDNSNNTNKNDPPPPPPPIDKDPTGSGHSFILPLLCKCSKQSTLHRVRKSGPTNSRLFWSCTGRKCDFFGWADLSFPKCQHGSVSTVRRVLKPGPTNGQYFFSCAQDTKCGFFLWTTKHITPPPPPSPSIPHQNNVKSYGIVQGGAEINAESLKRSSNHDNNDIRLKKFKFVTIPL